jgi:small ligand-binding sensory domain FIST
MALERRWRPVHPDERLPGKMTTENRFYAAHAAGPWERAVKRCLDQLEAASASANFGFVYVTDDLAGDLSSILASLRETTGIEEWVGTIGVGVCATGVEYFDEPALAIMVASLPPDSFHIVPTIVTDAKAFRHAHREWLERARPCFGIVHGDPRNQRTPALVAELAEAASVFLVGGLTSSRGAFDQVAGTLMHGGLSGVLFANEVEVATGLSQGCTPIGPIHTVTEGFDNVVVGLDGRPALQVLEEDAGKAVADDPLEFASFIDAAIPIPGSDTGDYLVRNLVGVDAEHGLLIIGERIAAGDKLLFVQRGRASAAADMECMLENIAGRISGPPRGGLYIACVGRGPNIFADDARELDMIRSKLGDFPLVGFFANGEISHNRLYGYTGVLTLFL